MTPSHENRGHRPRIYAHRGSTVLGPENTREAFDLALAAGAAVLEIDVRLSRDGHLIVVHDATVDRTTDGSGNVSDLPLATLKTLDAGFHAGSLDGRSYRGTGVRLMTLDELFQEYPQTAINIDIKDTALAATDALARCIERHGREHDTTVGSFHSGQLLYFRKQAPEVRTAAVRHEVARLYFARLAMQYGGVHDLLRGANEPTIARPVSAIAYGALQIPVSYRLIPLATRRFIRHATQLGLEVCYWTINDPVQMRKLLQLGAHGIITDRPDLAAAVFVEMGLTLP